MIERINISKLTSYLHSVQPDTPAKSAQEMKELFDAMPKKVLIPKINELINEINAGGYGKSAYELAVEHGFTGDEFLWLESLKGEQGEVGPQGVAGPKGETGDNGIVSLNDINGITKSGIYIVNGELYSAFVAPYSDEYEWDGNLTVPFYLNATKETLDELSLSYDKSSIYDGDDLEGYPLLKYNNNWGDGSGGTYIFLSENARQLRIYISDIADSGPWEIADEGNDGPISPVDATQKPIDLSILVEGGFADSTGAVDICGNFALLKRYFQTREEQNTGISIKKLIPVATDADEGKIMQVKDGVWTATDIESSAVKTYIDSYINEALGGDY